MKLTASHIPNLRDNGADAQEPVLLACLQNDADLRQLSTYLSDSFKVVTAKCELESRYFDLCLVDRPTLQSNADFIREYQQDQAPAFVPFVLLERNSRWRGSRDPLMDLVTDVVPMPVSPHMLRSRIDTLLQTRAYSLQMLRQNEKLQEERAFIDSAIQSLPGLFYVLNSDMEFIKWNDNLQRELGYTEEELLSMHPAEFFRPEEREKVYRALGRGFEQGSAELELDIRTREGAYIPYYITGKRFTRDGEHYLVGTCTNLSDLKEARFEMSKQRQLLNAIINQTESLIYVKDREGRKRLVNDKFLELFDVSREEAIGKTDLHVHSEEESGMLSENDRKVFRSGRVHKFEEEVEIKGEKRQFLSIKYPLKDVPGFEDCIAGISTDITDRVSVNRELDRQTRLLKNLFEYSPTAIALVNSREEVQAVNQSFLKIFQYSREEAEGQKINSLITPEGESIDQQELLDHYRTTGEKMQFESVRYRKDGSRVPVLVGAVPVQTDSGSYGSYVLYTDLTTQKDTEKKLEESRQRWESLVQNDPDLIQITKADGTILYVNPAGAEMYGAKDPQSLIGKNYFDLLEIDEPEIARERIEQVLKGEPVPPRDYHLVTKDGRERYVQVQAVPITLENGETALQQVGQDLTGRVAHEKELEQSIRDREVLLQEIHHRVKNNLAVVSGLLQMQRFDSEDETLNNLLLGSEMRIKSMALIHEKLYKSKSLSNVAFDDYIKDLVETTRKTVEGLQHIHMPVESDPVTLNVNQAVPCALIINELLSNATEHAFKGRKEGTVRLHIREKGDKVCVAVHDDGCGMPDSVLEGRRHSMGYTIVRTLVEQLDAELEIRNKGGAEISFTFEKQQAKGASSNFLT